MAFRIAADADALEPWIDVPEFREQLTRGGVRARRLGRVAAGHGFGMSLFGSMNGLGTVVAHCVPDGVSTSNLRPSSACSIGSIAKPMFFSSCGEWHALVMSPIFVPLSKTGKKSIISLSM